MKLNKKGFTLIELLAVIVVLAIILVIAVPNVLSTINSSKKSSLLSSAKQAASTFNTEASSAKMLNEGLYGVSLSDLNDASSTTVLQFNGGTGEGKKLFNALGLNSNDYSTDFYAFYNGTKWGVCLLVNKGQLYDSSYATSSELTELTIGSNKYSISITAGSMYACSNGTDEAKSWS